MKTRSYWLLGLIVGVLLIIVPLISAIVTATGAFGADPTEKVNRVDFVWAVVGLIILAFCFYRYRHIERG